MSLLNTTLQTLVVRLRDMSGNVTQQKLHNRVFDAYEAKSLVFEVITPEQQAVMRQFGSIPPQHPVGQPLLLDGWADLVSVHRDDNLYQLLPRRAKSNASYNTMRAICCSAGSPFTMDHRVDPIDYKLVFRAADMEVRNQFNAKNPDKLPPSIWFDGILSAPNDSGLVSCHNTLSPAHINNLAGMFQFLKEWSHEPPEGDRHRQLKQMYSQLLAKRTHLFIGSTSVPSREILNYAKAKNVFVYAKKGMRYAFHA
ncbi:hypothetical protein ERJ75_001745800 [Trypanosoma vivax]|uniref:Present in the outer mitochondrial membrane proteome 5 n=1 Tax=Trypanosoma vivax (strain Y486) TaxID=1055687 RepID=G0U2Q0_TRYVY|nr:hypothetical protein TRVL_02272 [Trypanosoma vivax]KAH8604297.1 hypothetical protein ERJ75_001745800 [Trypanosoma vivax]CCC50553.1 conserved hypothetical protein [Trypanosoma vivax Y486]